MNASSPKSLLIVACLAALLLTACGTTPRQPPAEPPDPLYQLLEDQTRRLAELAMQQALEIHNSGDNHSWQGADGSSGTVTPLRTFRILTGHYCRDYGVAVRTRLVQTTATRTACRSEGGEWINVTPKTEPPES